MIKKTFALYRGLLLCLCLLAGCATTTAPYQAMSDARQALAGAQTQLNTHPQATEKDKQDYQRAAQALAAAEAAINRGQHTEANRLIQQSQQYSQGILQRLRAPSNSSIKFRH